MEKRDRFVLEVLLGAIFVVLLILLAFLVTTVSAGSDSKTTITNSYNTNTYATQPATTTSALRTYSNSKPYIIDRSDYRNEYRYGDYDYYNVYYFDDDYYDGLYGSDRRYLRYDDDGRLRRTKGIFGNNINSYEVYVYNKDYTGGYFTVTYYFEDYYGQKTSYSETKYISARDEKRFLFKDISPGDYDYRYSWYEVSSKTKAPGKVYYN